MDAAKLKVGQTFPYRETRVTILRGQEPWNEPFGRPGFFRYWALREDTGAEGWMEFGPGGAVPDA
jgi:hypothetical protein